MILSFKPQFTDKILNGSKIHTFRKDSKNRWKIGNIIHFANGIRTKNYNCFKIGKCISKQKIKIKHYLGSGNYPLIYIDERLISNDEFVILYKNDGFESAKSFCEWFNEDFEGVIIHWTDFKY